MSGFFFDQREQLVDDAIEGVILSSPHRNLTRLDIEPGIRVVMRSDWNKSRVAVISGGGAGHEPADVGFVGRGMLTAAVCGDLFASPGVDAILNAIVAVTGDRGCLLIVKNYTGDRLNFGLAAEKAKRYGLKVEMVVVGDDIALSGNQPRGIAGTALVHKVAGYAAEQGWSLGEVREIARQASENVFSLGVALRSCSLPDGVEDEWRIPPGRVEMGLGLHGEPGVRTLNTRNSRALVDLMVEQLWRHAGGDVRLALLVNNLGGTSEMEMALIVKALAHSRLRDQVEFMIGPAPLMSALDMKGFSLSILRLSDAFIDALQAPSETLGWPLLVPFTPMKVQPQRPAHDRVDALPSYNEAVAMRVAALTLALIETEAELNALDARVGDGNTGTSFARGAREIARLLALGMLPLNDQAALLALIGERLATVMGGTSGGLMSIFFTAAGCARLQGQSLEQSLMVGLQQIKLYGGAKPGDRTLIDALQPALEVLAGEGVIAAAAAARRGAEATAAMSKANAGRSAYIASDRLSGVKDPGAAAIATAFSALAEVEEKNAQ
ncbi:DAK2 domain-containing protein [Erwinia sp. CPCC 100877]|nr:DAK2 domain-containing protein [Erwinia sp. CPCC 100877]